MVALEANKTKINKIPIGCRTRSPISPRGLVFLVFPQPDFGRRKKNHLLRFPHTPDIQLTLPGRGQLDPRDRTWSGWVNCPRSEWFPKDGERKRVTIMIWLWWLQTQSKKKNNPDQKSNITNKQTKFNHYNRLQYTLCCSWKLNAENRWRRRWKKHKSDTVERIYY